MNELFERDLIHILSVCKDWRQGYAKPEQSLEVIQRIAANGMGMWACRFCKEVFSNKVAKESDYFGDKCLSCATRAELVRKCNA